MYQTEPALQSDAWPVARESQKGSRRIREETRISGRLPLIILWPCGPVWG